MNGEEIFGMIIMVFCSLLCALTFVALGWYARHRKDPMHFYTGTTVDPRTISDIPAYNLENARMWETYAIPYALAGVVSFFRIGWGAIVMTLACFPGMLWLLWRYRKICNKYMVR